MTGSNQCWRPKHTTIQSYSSIWKELKQRAGQVNLVGVSNYLICHWKGENVTYLNDVIESETAGLHNLLHVTVESRLWISWSPLHFRCRCKGREVGLSTPSLREISSKRRLDLGFLMLQWYL